MALLERLLAGPPLFSGRLRRCVPVVSVVAIVSLAGFGFAVRNSARALLFDRSADVFFGRASGFEHGAATLLSDIGDPTIFITIMPFTALVLIFLGDYRAAVTTVASGALAGVLVEEVLKPFFDRRLDNLAGPTFPSGHAAVAVALAVAVTLAASGERPLGRLMGPVPRKLLVAIVALLSCTVGLAMVVLQVHYLSDVVAGISLGLSVGACTALCVDVIATRWQPQRGSVTGRSRLSVPDTET
ncbi:MAG TPA: phosphatase PAP2 family protein [Acidimicrobiales bacterium]|nr:phosphatase PAP2 family protein [Acidimicrobiales bacterium]